MENYSRMEWRELPKSPKYLVSSTGLVYNVDRGRLLKQSKVDGYFRVNLTKAYVLGSYYYNKPIGVHRLVAFVFLGQPEEGKDWVDHLDNDPSNNDVSNLEWVTPKDNIQRSYDRDGRVAPSGENHWAYGSKFLASTKRKMSEAKKGDKHPKFKGWYRIDGVDYGSAREASDATGMSSKQIWRISKKSDDNRVVFISVDQPKVRKRKVKQYVKGEDHHKFTGWYEVFGVRYSSSLEAEKATGINYKSIQRWSKSDDYPEIKFISKDEDYKYVAHGKSYESLEEIAKVQDTTVETLERVLSNPKQVWLKKL